MAYLTVAEYLARFGERETILLTNTTAPAPGGTATYDSAKVEAALADAEEVVESYVGRRYATPIADPPRIVKGWTATLGREALHVNSGKVPQPIQDAADRVRGQLKDVSNGLLTLPIETGSSAPEVKGQGFARSSNDRPAPTFSGGGALDAFVAPFTGGAEPACWRSGT